MKKEVYKQVDYCRSCGSSNLSEILSLGEMYISNFVNSKEQQGFKTPLELILCDKDKGGCGLLQLKHSTNPDLMWGDQYWYKSGINAMIRDDLKDIVNKSKKIIPLSSGDRVVDIGSNDGTLLGYYNLPGLNLVGFEPSNNVAKEAQKKGINVINDFFNAEAYLSKFKDKSKIITAISMFYDLDNPNKFLKDVSSCLDKDGLFVIQQNYLATMLKNNAVDNLCNEHGSYYSYSSLENLLNRNGFETFDVELNEINGGSIRNYIKLKEGNIAQSKEAKKRVDELIKEEQDYKLNNIETYLAFANRVNSIKSNLLSFLHEEKDKGKKICALGASTRGNTLLQYFNLDTSLIDCIFDKNPDKEGKMAVGSLIPITSPENIRKYNPDYQLVLICHIFKGVGEDEKSFLKKGGKFILPLPEIKIIK
jgi:SAM-dependent methyltransferase